MTKRTRASKRATNHFILNWNKMFERRGWRATKRQRCDVCGAYGHIYENCFLLEKSEEIEQGLQHKVPHMILNPNGYQLASNDLVVIS